MDAPDALIFRLHTVLHRKGSCGRLWTAHCVHAPSQMAVPQPPLWPRVESWSTQSAVRRDADSGWNIVLASQTPCRMSGGKCGERSAWNPPKCRALARIHSPRSRRTHSSSCLEYSRTQPSTSAVISCSLRLSFSRNCPTLKKPASNKSHPIPEGSLHPILSDVGA